MQPLLDRELGRVFDEQARSADVVFALLLYRGAANTACDREPSVSEKSGSVPVSQLRQYPHHLTPAIFQFKENRNGEARIDRTKR